MPSRREFLHTLLGVALASPLACQRGRREPAQEGRPAMHPTDTAARPQSSSSPSPPAPAQDRMPVVFVGHGSPMNVVEDNPWSRGFAALGQELPRPRAIVAISAHWLTRGTLLTVEPAPRTIHDFSGFPQALYEVQYPAPGHPSLARQVQQLLGEDRARTSTDWGLDHGTWSVLRWMFPDADIPVIQLSLDRRLRMGEHHELARSLIELRSQGVLILGSGNITHNLGDAFGRMRSDDRTTPDWAARFDGAVETALDARDREHLIGLWHTDDGRRAHPTPEHWIPLLYAQAATDENDPIRYTSTAFDWGSLSMRNVIFG